MSRRGEEEKEEGWGRGRESREMVKVKVLERQKERGIYLDV